MGLLQPRGRGRPTAAPGARCGDPPAEQDYPVGLTGVEEALASGADPEPACVVAGEQLATAGVGLDEALQRLETTCRVVTGGEPDFAATRALSYAWGEATLSMLRRVSCEEPLTGLTTLTHLRTRLAELQRGVGLPGHRVAPVLVVAELDGLPTATAADPWARSLVVARLGNAARTVFPGEETISHVAPQRVVVLTRRDDRLPRRTDLLRRLWHEAEPPTPAALRTWIEGVPEHETGALQLLDELARAG